MDRQALKQLVERHAAQEGVTETPIEGVRLFRFSHPFERLPAVYPPSLCCIVQGRKRAYLRGAAHTYDVDHYICGTMPLPVEAEVLNATPDKPVLGVMIDLETRSMAETLVAYEAAAGPSAAGSAKELSPGLVLVPVDDGFLTVVAQLLALLDDPVALRVLASSRLRELLFAIIVGGAGPLVRRTFGGAPDLTRALTFLRDNLDQPHTVDDLAAKAGMSRAVFHRRFKEATSFSPLQFIKALRLNSAAMQIVAGAPVSQAADAVGYTSASQFSREFRRQFGTSPRQWAKTAAAPVPEVQAASA